MAQRPIMNGFLAWSLLSVIALVVVVVASLPAVGRAVFTNDPGAEEVGERFSLLIADHESAMTTYRERFDGRSIFFKPRQPRVAPPPRPPRTEPKVVAAPKTDPEPPAEKPRPPYSGPAVTGIFGESVFFSGHRAAVGDPVVDNLEVLSVDAPWSVKVRFRDWEYDLDLFDNDFDSFLPTEKNETPSEHRGLLEEGETPNATVAAMATPETSPDDPSDNDSKAAKKKKNGKKANGGRARAKPAGAGGQRKASQDE